MAYSQSATSALKEKFAVLVVTFIGAGVLLHVTIPWFDFPSVIGTIYNFGTEYSVVPKFVIGGLILLFFLAKISDHFRT